MQVAQVRFRWRILEEGAHRRGWLVSGRCREARPRGLACIAQGSAQGSGGRLAQVVHQGRVPGTGVSVRGSARTERGRMAVQNLLSCDEVVYDRAGVVRADEGHITSANG